MVMDVEHSNPDPGTPVISYCQNDPELVHNQLWMKQHVDEKTFYLVSKLGPDCKMTILVIISCSLYFLCTPTELLLFKFVFWVDVHKLVFVLP